MSMTNRGNNAREQWAKLREDGKPDRIVEVDVVDETYTPEELKRMIEESGIPEDEWMKWKESQD